MVLFLRSLCNKIIVILRRIFHWLLRPERVPQFAHAESTPLHLRQVNDDFRLDVGGTPNWDFIAMMKAGEKYLDLPVPRRLDYDYGYEKEAHGKLVSEKSVSKVNASAKDAAEIFTYISPPLVSIMADTDIGIGTDPERLDQNILNKKKEVLQRSIFATCLLSAGLHETVQTVHTFTEESVKKTGRKLDFGIAGGFDGVQLGFEAAHSTMKEKESQNIIAVADLRFQFATTESRIRTEMLFKYLTSDCRKDLLKLAQSDRSTFPCLISDFFGKYGTHVVLRCTHGYRLENVQRYSVKGAKEMEDIKVGMMYSLFGYLGINMDINFEQLNARERSEYLLGIKNIGSKVNMKRALEGELQNKDIMECINADDGDAGVISHDWKMMIAEIVSYEEKASPKNQKAVYGRLCKWTKVRINDLRSGWNEGLFSASFLLKFKHRSEEDAVSVTMGGFTTVHTCPHEKERLSGYVTNVPSDEVNCVQLIALPGRQCSICTTIKETALFWRQRNISDIISHITVYRRFVDDEFDGFVLATKIDLPDRSENDYEMCQMLFDLQDYESYKEVLKGYNIKANHTKGCIPHSIRHEISRNIKDKRQNNPPDESALHNMVTQMENTEQLTIAEARAKLCTYLSF